MAWGRKQRIEPTEDVLFDASTIDLVTLPPDGNSVELHIVSDSQWTGSDAQIQSLQETINRYVSYAADGQLASTYPEAASLPWSIVIQCRSGAPDARTADVLARTRQPIQKYGGDLIVNA